MKKSEKRLRLLLSIISICFGLFLVNTAIADTTIGTTPSWNGSENISDFGYPDTATYGESITVPATDTVLQNFTFYMRLPIECTFRGYVYAWNGSRADGPELFESPTMHTTQSVNFEAVTFTIPGGLELTEGFQYVLFASVSRESGSGYGSWGFVRDGGYSSTFVYLNNGTNDSLWTSANWDTWGDNLAFSAFFTPGDEGECEWIPETAWSEGTRYLQKGDWATYTTWGPGVTATLYAGQTMEAGTVNFSAVDDGDVTITITLNEGWRFADVEENVKIEGYALPPTRKPNLGKFTWKDNADDSPYSIVVDEAGYYGVHVDVEWEDCSAPE